MTYDVIIVGSGPSGVASAVGFAEKGIIPLILDVGNESTEEREINENFFDYRKAHDSFDLMIGDNYEGLHNVINEKPIFPKLISPYMQFVVKDSERLSPVHEKGFTVTQSFAMGGLANAWGAALYRCRDDEFGDMPLKASELSPYYDKLTKEIGISGDNDDLACFFGSTDNLLSPLPLSNKAAKLYSSYLKRKKRLNAKGIYMGRSRLSVLSQDYDNRNKCDYKNLESWMPNLSYVYNPSFTLKKLIKNNIVIYQKSVLVKYWSRKNNIITVYGEDTNNGDPLSFECKKLILAAGAVNTSKIVLKSKEDHKSRLTLIDNGLVQVPMIFPSFLGTRFETGVLGLTGLNMVFDFQKQNLRLQGSIIDLTFPFRSIFTEMFPFAFKDSMLFTKYFLPALSVMLLYLPSGIENSGYVRLCADDSLETVSLPYKINKKILRAVSLNLLSLGVLTHPLIVKNTVPGYAIHYAGTLPMVKTPVKGYQCDKNGELYGESGVHIADGSLFSYIPAKNISFTLMANAMRISDHISKEIKSR